MQFLGPKHIATMLDVDEKTARRMFQRGEIPAFRAGPKLWRTTREDFEAWAAEKLGRSSHLLPLRVLVRDRNRVIPVNSNKLA